MSWLQLCRKREGVWEEQRLAQGSGVMVNHGKWMQAMRTRNVYCTTREALSHLWMETHHQKVTENKRSGRILWLFSCQCHFFSFHSSHSPIYSQLLLKDINLFRLLNQWFSSLYVLNANNVLQKQCVFTVDMPDLSLLSKVLTNTFVSAVIWKTSALIPAFPGESWGFTNVHRGVCIPHKWPACKMHYETELLGLLGAAFSHI